MKKMLVYLLYKCLWWVECSAEPSYSINICYMWYISPQESSLQSMIHLWNTGKVEGKVRNQQSIYYVIQFESGNRLQT